MINSGGISDISQNEVSAYRGPVNYSTHHDVFKPGSLSTPVRLVSNSSFKNGTTNLNDLTVKGPNTLADIFENLFKFRSYQVTLIFDISKAYNSIRTGLVEKHLRRLWFHFNPQEEWKLFGFNCVQFGDQPAAALMTIAVEMAADSYQAVAQKSKRILENSFKTLMWTNAPREDQEHKFKECWEQG